MVYSYLGTSRIKNEEMVSLVVFDDILLCFIMVDPVFLFIGSMFFELLINAESSTVH